MCIYVEVYWTIYGDKLSVLKNSLLCLEFNTFFFWRLDQEEEGEVEAKGHEKRDEEDEDFNDIGTNNDEFDSD